MTQIATHIDVREIAPRERHATIFATFQGLAPGESFELVTDHEPVPLAMQFQIEWPGQFEWQVIEAGPVEWRVRIVRQAARKSCCGCCGG